MAIWQFKVELIPEMPLRRRFGGAIPIALPEIMRDDSGWMWEGWRLAPVLIERLDRILPRAISWSESIIMWGKKGHDTASIGFGKDTGTVEWIEFRVDASRLSIFFLQTICILACELNCVLLSQENAVITPSETTLLGAIEHSTALRFVRDPVSTLLSIRDKFGNPA